MAQTMHDDFVDMSHSLSDVTATRTVSTEELARAFGSISGKARPPKTLKGLRRELDEARRTHVEEVRTIESFITARGFAAFQRRMQSVSTFYARKAESVEAERKARKSGGQPVASAGARSVDRSQIEAKPIDAAAVLPAELRNDPFLAPVARLLSAAKSEKGRIDAMEKAIAHGMAHAMNELSLGDKNDSRFEILRRSHELGSFSVLNFAWLLHPETQDDPVASFEKLIDSHKRDKKVTKRGRMPSPASDFDGLRSAVAVTLEKADADTAQRSAADAAVKTLSFVAAQIGASEGEMKAAALKWFEVDTGSGPGSRFILDAGKLSKPGGEQKLRSEFAAKIEEVSQAAKSWAVDLLGNHRRSSVEREVWTHWRELAGDLTPGPNCPAAREALAERDKAIDMRSDLAENRKTCIRLASSAERVSKSQSRRDLAAIANMRKSLRRATLDPTALGYLQTATKSIRKAVSSELGSLEKSGRNVGKEFPVWVEPHAVDDNAKRAASQIQLEANSTGRIVVVANRFDTAPLIAYPGGKASEVFEAWRSAEEGRQVDLHEELLMTYAQLQLLEKASRTKTDLAVLATTERPRDLDAIEAALGRAAEPSDLRHPGEIEAYVNRTARSRPKMFEEFVSVVLSGKLQDGTLPFWMSAIDRAAVGAL